jgi:transcriptional regulator with XRE-family HTH domain
VSGDILIRYLISVNQKSDNFRKGSMPLGEELSSLRKTAGMSQKDLADKCGISQPMISALESGKETDLRASTLVAIAKALGVDCNHFAPFLSAAEEPVAKTKKKAKKK